MFGFSVPEDVYSVKSTIVSMSVLGFTVVGPDKSRRIVTDSGEILDWPHVEQKLNYRNYKY